MGSPGGGSAGGLATTRVDCQFPQIPFFCHNLVSNSASCCLRRTNVPKVVQQDTLVFKHMSLTEHVDRLNAIVDADRGLLSGESRTLVEQLVREFLRDPTGVDPTVLQLSRAAHGVLLQYGGRCAVEAVIGNSRDRVTSGLTAVVIENGAWDIRDTVRTLAKFFHSASLLTMDTAALFDQFAGMCRSERLALRFREFSVPAGSPSAHLRHFGLRTSGTVTTFRYKDDESLTRALRMYITAPSLSFPQKVRFIFTLLHQEREKWQFWRR